jgi:hypothetical protein
MAITINWPTKVINVPKADMLLVQSVPSEIRELDIDAFRLELKAIEASIEGMPFVDTHSHSPPVTVGGVTLARVVEIINGYTVTFEDDQYAVNLVGANSNIGDVANVNQVSVRSANSAGLTYSKEIEDQSFEGAMVWIDTVGGLSGTQFPRGTPGDPVNNLDDAKSIILNRGLPLRIHLRGDLILGTGDSLADYSIFGAATRLSSINFGGANTTDMIVENVDLTGMANGAFTAQGTSAFSNLDDFAGTMIGGGLDGTISLAGAASKHEFIDCYSRVSGISTPIIDCDDLANLDLAFRSYDGGIELRNISSSNSTVSIDLNSGHVVLDSSVSAGDIVIRGTGYITDNSTGTASVNITGLTFGTSGLTPTESTQLGQIDILRKLMQNRMETDPTTGIMTIYDDDDTTPFLTGNIYEDILAAQAYRGRGIERRNRLT